jgi:hypothetical protein
MNWSSRCAAVSAPETEWPDDLVLERGFDLSEGVAERIA